MSNCGFEEFPDVVCMMPSLCKVDLKRNKISILSETVATFMMENFSSFNEFSEKYSVKTSYLEQPPLAILQSKGAFQEYINAIRASSLVKCSVLSVQILGKTSAGKSSLIHTLKKGESHLVDPTDRTVVVDTVEVKQEEALIQFTDFGGHDIYELTCSLFMKSRHQTTFIAVKLSEYSEETHDELVTKWLSTALTHMNGGQIHIVVTQVDLCEEEEVTSKMSILGQNISKWMESEQNYKMKINKELLTKKTSDFKFENIRFFLTSSANMQGMDKLKKFLFDQAQINKLSLPSHWSKMYAKLLGMKSTDKIYIKMDEAYSIFKKSLSIVRKLSSTKKDPEHCLDFLHSIGMLLWYKDNDNLRDVVFHNMSAVVEILQELFHHNLCEHLKYDGTEHGKFIGTRTQYDSELTSFHQTGILSENLLNCLWNTIDPQMEHFETMKQMVIQLELCFIEEGRENTPLLRFPWFVHREDSEGIVAKQWPESLPPGRLQYSLVYTFFHRIPSTMYERFCVRLQKYLTPGGHFRQDFKDMVFITQSEVQILIQRNTRQSEPSLQIHLRTVFAYLPELQLLLLDIYNDLDSMCSELPRVVVDAYFLCPHCLLIKSPNPRKRPAKQLSETSSRKGAKVLCDPGSVDNVQFAAALVFLKLLREFIT